MKKLQGSDVNYSHQSISIDTFPRNLLLLSKIFFFSWQAFMRLAIDKRPILFAEINTKRYYVSH